jgi:hypothetical protein
MPRNARIDVEELCHVTVNIGPSTASCIATKERTSLVTFSGRHSKAVHFIAVLVEILSNHQDERDQELLSLSDMPSRIGNHRSGKPAPPIQLRHDCCSQMRMPPPAVLF